MIFPLFKWKPIKSPELDYLIIQIKLGSTFFDFFHQILNKKKEMRLNIN